MFSYIRFILVLMPFAFFGYTIAQEGTPVLKIANKFKQSNKDTSVSVAKYSEETKSPLTDKNTLTQMKASDNGNNNNIVINVFNIDDNTKKTGNKLNETKAKPSVATEEKSQPAAAKKPVKAKKPRAGAVKKKANKAKPVKKASQPAAKAAEAEEEEVEYILREEYRDEDGKLLDVKQRNATEYEIEEEKNKSKTTPNMPAFSQPQASKMSLQELKQNAPQDLTPMFDAR
jgi:hypothetical protein